MSSHSRLAPSASQRWLNCPGSVALSDLVPPRPSGPAAQEGTEIHELAAQTLLARVLGGTDPMGCGNDEWTAVVDTYVGAVSEQMQGLDRAELFVERLVDPLIPQCKGTADAIVLDDDEVRVIDLKTGRMPVSADSPQLRIYGLGALALRPRARRVRLVIVQPRLERIDTHDMLADDLRGWRVEVALPAARTALSPGAPFSPSEEACRWCPAAGMCRAQTEWVLSQDFGDDPSTMSAVELAEALERVDQIEQWAGQVRAAAVEHAEWEQLPGWELADGRGRRRIVDEEAALDALVAAGLDPTEVQVSRLANLSVLDKATRGKLSEVLGDQLVWTPGAPKLRRRSD